MRILTGKGVSKGAVCGMLRFYRRKVSQVPRQIVSDCDAEFLRLTAAMETASEQLGELAEKARMEMGEEAAILFETHQMMLEDDDFCEAIRQQIQEERLNAEAAVADVVDLFAAQFEQLDDAYMQARASDVRDVGGRIVRILCGAEQEAGIPEDGNAYIIAAEDLTPSETVQLDKSRILGFVMSEGTPNSHTAILARTLGIPAVMHMGAELWKLPDGCEVFLDGQTGQLVTDPDDVTRVSLLEHIQQEQDYQNYLEMLKGLPNETPDGRAIDIFANIGSVSDLDAVLANDAGGIGLFRSEFLFLEGQDYPDEETQFQCYRAVAQRLEGKKVVIRTLDIGSDKTAEYFHLEQEQNPALGFRAIRICLTRPDIFRTQLRALCRASAYGNIAIMFPMITSEWEVLQAKELCAQVQEELAAENIPYNRNMEIGIMLETPAAVVIADILAQHVDFFSIGTNDLTQYTLAIDRQSRNLDRFYDAHHPAVLRMIRHAAQTAHDAGIWIGICGELGADQSLTETFLEYGVDEISVSPASVLPIRKVVRTMGLSAEKGEE